MILSRFKLHSVFIFFIACLMTMASCSRNPVTGKRQFMLLSKKGESRMGASSDPGIVASFGLYQDQKLQRFIDQKGQAMAKISHRPELDYEFKILDSPVVNAFAVPGGYVYFTRGILAHFNNEAEFAGVLGHEIGHITARHSAQQYSKSMLAQIGFIVGVVFSPEFRQYSDVASQGLGLLFLKFGRDHESQSDQLGVEYSTKIGYDAHQMANFFNTLKRMRGDTNEEIPTFLSTHPDPADRNQKVGEMADEAQTGKPASKFKVGRDSYLRMIDGLIYGEDPRQGYVKNNKFYHPELKFQFPVPSGWRTQNSPQQFQMAPEDGKAMMILSIGQGKTLDEAAQNAIETDQIKVASSNKTNINGNSALSLLGELENGVRLQIMFIKYGNLIYKISGLAMAADFGQYKNYFLNTMEGFKKLTDPALINVKPDVIRIKTVKSNTIFQKAMQSFNVPANKMEEHALLNSMVLKDPVDKGMLLKVIEEQQ